MDYRIGQSGGSLGPRDYYLEGQNLEAEYANGALQTRYFRGIDPDELIVRYDYATGSAVPSIFHQDDLQNVTGLSAHDGQMQEGRIADVFGYQFSRELGTNNRLGFAGRERDFDVGLYYNRARYYDPYLGRFISEDPLGFSAGINFYAYANNNPINANDPTGQDANVSVSGNKVNIQIPIAYSGNAATPELIAQLNAAIQNQWSGSIGKYSVSTTVTPPPAWYNITSASNSVALVNNLTGKGSVGGCDSPTSCVVGSSTGTWFQPGQGDPVWEATHETGHLLGLPDQYVATTVNGQRTSTAAQGYETNIMAAYGQTGVTEQDISNVINANPSWYSKAINTITGLFTGDQGTANSGSSSSAAGGYLIYPNMPNNNGLQAAYGKP